MTHAFESSFQRFQQVRTLTIFDSRPVIIIDNAAEARIQGLDLAAVLRLSPRLSLDLGVVWLPRRNFVDYTTLASNDTLSANKLSGAPEWSRSASIEYSVPVRELGNFRLRVDYNSRSQFFFTSDNDSVLAQEGFGLLNLFLRFDSARERWYVLTSVRNATNTDYFTQAHIQSNPGYPRTYEAGFGLRF